MLSSFFEIVFVFAQKSHFYSEICFVLHIKTFIVKCKIHLDTRRTHTNNRLLGIKHFYKTEQIFFIEEDVRDSTKLS